MLFYPPKNNRDEWRIDSVKIKWQRRGNNVTVQGTLPWKKENSVNLFPRKKIVWKDKNEWYISVCFLNRFYRSESTKTQATNLPTDLKCLLRSETESDSQYKTSHSRSNTTQCEQIIFFKNRKTSSGYRVTRELKRSSDIFVLYVEEKERADKCVFIRGGKWRF